MILDEAVQDLIQRIYDAALAPGNFAMTLAQLGELLRGSAIAFGLQGIPAGGKISANYRYDPDSIKVFEKSYLGPDTNPVIPAMTAAPVGTLFTRSKLIPDKEWQRSGLFQEVFRPNNLWHVVPACLLREDRYMGVLSLARSKQNGDYDQHEQQLIRLLVPHFRRALQICLRMEAFEGERHAAYDSLDRLAVGIVMVNHNGQVVHMNQKAERLISLGKGLFLRKRRLSAQSSNDSRTLDRLINSAAKGEWLDLAKVGGTIILQRAFGQSPLSILVSPLGTAAHRFPNHPATVVFIRDPDDVMLDSSTLLQTAYGLTRQESALANLLAQGETLSTAAEKLRITRNTAHTHLKRIFERTGTHRQTDLVRLILRCEIGVAST